MAITSESQILNTDAVKAACSQIREGAEYFNTASMKINEAAIHCGSNALAVDGKSMQEEYIRLTTQFNDLRKNINDFCTSVESAAESIASSQRQQLQEYQESQKQNN